METSTDHSASTSLPEMTEQPSNAKGKPAPRRRPRILPVLILAAITAGGLRLADFVRADGPSSLFSSDGVDLGPGRPLMAQDVVDEPAEPEAAEPELAEPDATVAEAPAEMAEKTMAAEDGTPPAEAMMEDASGEEVALMSAQEALEQVEREESALGNEELSEGEIDLLMSLSERRRALEEREADLDGREALLRAAEMRIDEKVAELDQAKAEIELLIGKLDEAEEARLARLVQVYEIMKPAEAAKIFDGLERDVLLQVMERMSERKLAPVMAGMNPALARELTADLALRRRLPDLPES